MTHCPLFLVWSVQRLAELAEGPAECSEVARGGCLFAWTVSEFRFWSARVNKAGIYFGNTCA